MKIHLNTKLAQLTADLTNELPKLAPRIRIEACELLIGILSDIEEAAEVELTPKDRKEHLRNMLEELAEELKKHGVGVDED